MEYEVDSGKDLELMYDVIDFKVQNMDTGAGELVVREVEEEQRDFKVSKKLEVVDVVADTEKMDVGVEELVVRKVEGEQHDFKVVEELEDGEIVEGRRENSADADKMDVGVVELVVRKVEGEQRAVVVVRKNFGL